jgi:hypothetical protein
VPGPAGNSLVVLACGPSTRGDFGPIANLGPAGRFKPDPKLVMAVIMILKLPNSHFIIPTDRDKGAEMATQTALALQLKGEILL